ncbi:hypothetical protein AGMMS50233_08990 [Endomicrobiia bacterium]|nr:hypothetical protein AGMMS50233_08990 [Endomicrobiia bacterium]
MIKNVGQTLTEFILVFVVLLMAASGAFGIYKKFWSAKYKKVSDISGIAAGALKTSAPKMSYVK